MHKELDFYEQVVIFVLLFLVGLILGYAWRMYHESPNEDKDLKGLFIPIKENYPEVKESFFVKEGKYYTKYQAVDEKGKTILLLKTAPPFEVWFLNPKEGEIK